MIFDIVIIDSSTYLVFERALVVEIYSLKEKLQQRWLHYKELMLLNCGAGEILLRIPWTARRSNQLVLKEINPEYSLEGLMLKLKLQYFGHLIQRTDSLEKTLKMGKIDSRRG